MRRSFGIIMVFAVVALVGRVDGGTLDACEDGAYRCNGAAVDRCTGGTWFYTYSCATGETCVDGYCPPAEGSTGGGGSPPQACAAEADPYEDWAWEDLSGSNDVQTGAYTLWWYDDPCDPAPEPLVATLHEVNDVDWYRMNILASQGGCGLAPTFSLAAASGAYEVALYARCYWAAPSWVEGFGGPADQTCELAGADVVRCAGTGGLSLSDLRCPGQDIGDGTSHTGMEVYIQIQRAASVAAGSCAGTEYTLSFDF